MQRDLFSKWTLFITSYLPLYLWLLFSNINYSKISLDRLIAFDFDHKIIRIVFVVLIFVSIIKLRILFNKICGGKSKKNQKRGAKSYNKLLTDENVNLPYTIGSETKKKTIDGKRKNLTYWKVLYTEN